LKARRLLQEFQKAPLLIDEQEDLVAPLPPTKASSPSNQTTTTTTTSADGTVPSVASSTGDAAVIPESFWTNGHLQGSGDYVTRWAEGVKVAEPLKKYDPKVAERVLFRQPTKWVVRNVQIAVPLGLWASGVVTDFVMGKELDNRRSRATQLLKSITGLGPAIIKGGQALASRPDLMPSEYLEELQKLQDDVPTYSNELAFQTVEKELDIKFSEVFELLQTEPVAAASIGQVYKARLKSNGDIVALKIQRPNCEDVIALDLYVLRWWSGVANAIVTLLNRDINVQSIIDDFGELIYRELDYVAEAANAQRFNELYAGVTDVFVPKVYSELTTSKVLTMEWVDGFRLTDSASLEAYNLDRKKLVDILVQCSLRQILENGFFHADPHAGNLLACEDGRLCYLDFGMMSYAAVAQRNGFLLAVVHMVNRDWAELVRLYQRLGFIPEGTDLKPIEAALETALPDVLNADVSELNFKNVINSLGDIMYTYPFSLPPFYIAIIRCLGVLEGLAIQVDPKFRIISDAYPYIASRVLTDPQDDLQEALRRLAFTNDGHVRWERLEGLLEEAKGSTGYDVTSAIDQLTNYMLSEDGETLLSDFADQIVEGADNLGAETVGYVIEASRGLIINDEVSAVRAIKALQALLENGVNSDNNSSNNAIFDFLPEPSPSMDKFMNLAALLGSQENADLSKFIPLIRKLSAEPRIQRTASEIVARLSERALSRGLRAAFGLSPPVFPNGSSAATDEVRDTAL